MKRFRETATIFCDASYVRGSAGYGVVARMGGRLIAVSRRFRGEVASSGMAEALAVLGALQIMARKMPEIRAADIHIDCRAVVDAMSYRGTTRNIAHVVQAIDDFANDHGIKFDIHWVKGHRGSGPHEIANGIAHRLAWIGRCGEHLDLETRFSIDWQKRLRACDIRLMAMEDHAVVPFDEVAAYLSVRPDTVAQLIRHGYLDYDSDGVPLSLLNRVARELMEMRMASRQAPDMEQDAPAMAS